MNFLRKSKKFYLTTLKIFDIIYILKVKKLIFHLVTKVFIDKIKILCYNINVHCDAPIDKFWLLLSLKKNNLPSVLNET